MGMILNAINRTGRWSGELMDSEVEELRSWGYRVLILRRVGISICECEVTR